MKMRSKIVALGRQNVMTSTPVGRQNINIASQAADFTLGELETIGEGDDRVYECNGCRQLLNEISADEEHEEKEMWADIMADADKYDSPL